VSGAVRGSALKLALALGALAIVGSATPRLLAAPPLSEHAPLSTAVYAERGELLRLTLAADGQYRLWAPLEEIAPAVRDAVVLYEDRWFFWHPGVNPIALARGAARSALGGRRQGGSTLSMQLARRLDGVDSRTVTGKLRQIAGAMWLELRYSKREILEAYLNLAPFGGNVEGVGAASLVYFGKRPSRLGLAESLTLAVIPQNPRRRLPSMRLGPADEPRHELAGARERLWRRWSAARKADAGRAVPVSPLMLATSSSELPFRAPHLVDSLLRGGRPPEPEIWASIDVRVQATVERMIRRYVNAHRPAGIRNAAALLVDTKTMEVKALVGSAGYFDDEIDGQVNGVFAKRSPGSTLKPFVYALGLDQGLVHPLTILRDVPTAFGPFSPENFDGRFVGPISVQDALVRSRNVPAVAVAARLSQPNLYEFLRSAGVSKLAPERHYGLALVLGGGEVTMEELARLYAMLANEGELRPLRYIHKASPHTGAVRLISPAAAFITLEMLRANPRPDSGRPSAPVVAWKTGTSWGFRDAWSVGVFGRYVLVVWLGNFDGAGNPAFVGVTAAAPLFFQIIDGIRGQGLDPGEPTRAVPATVSRVEVCATSGDLPNAPCRERATTWFIPGKSPIKVSTLHRPVIVDTRTGRAVCAEGPFTRREIYEFWPADMLRLFREAGMPRREPPEPAVCGRAQTPGDSSPPQITSPSRGAVYTIRLSSPIAIDLRATDSSRTLFWFADRGFLGRTDSADGLAWIPTQAGRYTVRVLDEAGRSDVRDVSIEIVP